MLLYRPLGLGGATNHPVRRTMLTSSNISGVHARLEPDHERKVQTGPTAAAMSCHVRRALLYIPARGKKTGYHDYAYAELGSRAGLSVWYLTMSSGKHNAIWYCDLGRHNDCHLWDAILLPWLTYRYYYECH